MPAPIHLTRLQSPSMTIVAVARLALDGEELAERRGSVAVLHRQGGDLGDGLAGEVVRRDALGLDGDGRCRAVA